MPLYDYQCSTCGHEWEQFKKIENRDEPVNQPCPECENEDTVHLLVGGGHIADPMRLGKVKPPSDFTGILKRIASENPGHNMKIRD